GEYNGFNQDMMVYIPYIFGDAISLSIYSREENMYQSDSGSHSTISINHGLKELFVMTMHTKRKPQFYWIFFETRIYSYFNHHISVNVFEDDVFHLYWYLDTCYKQIKQAQLIFKIPLSYKHISVLLEGYLNEKGFKSNFDIEFENYKLFNLGMKYYNSIEYIQEYKVYLEHNTDESKHSAYIQYSGQKIGYEYQLSEDFFYHLMDPYYGDDKVLRFRINLPFEEYELISVEQVFTPYFPLPVKSEVRFGHLGYTFSYNDNDNIIDMRLNKYKIQIRLFSSFTSNFWASFSMSIIPKPLIFTPLYLYIQTDEIHKIELNQGSDVILRLFMSWENTYGVGFKFLPVFPINIAFNIESYDNTDDYELDIDWNLWKQGYAGIHYHRDDLGSGSHTLFSVKSSDYGFNYTLESTLMSNSNLFNNDVKFCIDHDSFGYNFLLKRNSGFITTEYVGDIKFIFYDKGVNWNNKISSYFRNINGQSLLFYENFYNPNSPFSNMTISEEPMVLRFDYWDMSIFGYDNHIFELTFSNEEIEDVILYGYLIETLNGTHIMNSTMMDKNHPEKHILVKFINYPEGHIFAEFQQPSSGFEIEFDTKEEREGYRYFYITLCNSWNSSQEIIVETIDKTNFNVDFKISNNQNWYGGISLNSWLPEINMYWNLRANSSYTQRLRAGLSSPREMTIVFEHQHLNDWEQDAWARLHLIKGTTGDYIQFDIKYSPEFIDNNFFNYDQPDLLLLEISMIIYEDFNSLWMDMKRVELFNISTIERVLMIEKQKMEKYIVVCQHFVDRAEHTWYQWYGRITSIVYELIPTEEELNQFYQNTQNYFNYLKETFDEIFSEFYEVVADIYTTIEHAVVYAYGAIKE
ncbi:unnamed protein product, partial [Meganyctiphanes norvegica]